ncbi:MAG: hypothetical protein IKP06_02230 [Elusimicrobiaceae bacterium]|nr:hypothetical protein [Elusimicrobiaceae bacterium]
MKKIILCVAVLLTVLCGVARADVIMPTRSEKEDAFRQAQKSLKTMAAVFPPKTTSRKIYFCRTLSDLMNASPKEWMPGIPAKIDFSSLEKWSQKYNCQQLLNAHQLTNEEELKQLRDLPKEERWWRCKFIRSYYSTLNNQRERVLDCDTIAKDKLEEEKQKINAVIKKATAHFPVTTKTSICACRKLLSLQKHGPEISVKYIGRRNMFELTPTAPYFPHWVFGDPFVYLPSNLNCEELSRQHSNFSTLACPDDTPQTVEKKKTTPKETPEAKPTGATPKETEKTEMVIEFERG